MRQSIQKSLISWSHLFYIFIVPVFSGSQPIPGKVLSSETNNGIGFVNIGIIGKNIGTVSDKYGSFIISLDKVYDKDSLRFSMIGFESKTYLVREFREDSIKIVYLKPRYYTLPGIKVLYHRPKKLMLGNPVETDELRSGFSNNELGSELGIKVFARKKTRIEDLNLDVSICTYDSVTYRLNIYQLNDQIVGNNILTKPVYISFSKDKINNVLSFNLSEYSIIVEGDILIALELYKDPGKGKLLFRTEYFTGITYHRRTSQGTWTKSPGVIGMYLNCTVID